MTRGNTIIVKIGSDSLENFTHSKKITNLVDGIAGKMADWARIILVSSGAVSFGRSRMPEIENKQVLAALGWHHLLVEYSRKFHAHGTPIAGYLVTHADIEDNPNRSKTFVETIETTWDTWVLPIVNENDPISTEEMREVGRWADNDKNALLLAGLFQANILYLITNTNGVYRDSTDPESRIKSMKSRELVRDYIEELCNGKSLSGIGGMQSKLEVAHQAWKLGITTHIWNGIDSWIHDILSGWTTIIP